jgi:hypothetical protein
MTCSKGHFFSTAKKPITSSLELETMQWLQITIPVKMKIKVVAQVLLCTVCLNTRRIALSSHEGVIERLSPPSRWYSTRLIPALLVVACRPFFPTIFKAFIERCSFTMHFNFLYIVGLLPYQFAHPIPKTTNQNKDIKPFTAHVHRIECHSLSRQA